MGSSFAAGFKFDLHVLATVIGDPDSEVVSVGVIADFVATLRPPFRELIADSFRSRIQLNGTCLLMLLIGGDLFLGRFVSLLLDYFCLFIAELLEAV